MKINVIEYEQHQQQKCKHGTGACLTEDDIDFWYAAVRSDDIESVEKHLTSVGETRKAELLNGHVCAGGTEAMLDTVRGLNIKFAKQIIFTRLINIATIARAEKIIKMCLKNGVSVFEPDRNGDNVIHILIRASRGLPMLEKKYASLMTMFKTQLTTEQLQHLLHQEDNDGYRPLELAAHLGTFPLYNEIFETKDVYFRGKKNIGILSIHYYDITEYESYAKEDKTRRMKSPMWYFCHLENSKLEGTAIKEFFKTGPGKVWCELKIRSNWPLIFLWFLMRFSLVVLSQYWDLSGGSLTMQNRVDIDKVVSGNLAINETNCLIGTYVNMQSFIATPTVSAILQYIMTASASYFFIFDIVECVIWFASGWVKRFYRTPDGEIKSVISNALEFRITMVLICIAVIVMFTSMMVKHRPLADLSYLTFQFLLIWALLYFAQILPWIGPTVMNMQRLVKELLSYGVILCLLIVPMSYVIVSLLTKNHIGPCPDDIDFTDFFQTTYRGFIILLNMVNLTGYPLGEYLSIYAYHLIFVFLISILMLNFVIASFSTTIATMHENQQAIMMIQRLSIAMQVEYRVGAIFPSLIHWLHKRTFQYCPEAEAFYINRLMPREGPSTM